MQFTLDNEFQVAAGDCIGWTNEGTVGPISFDYAEAHHTYFYNFNGTNFPQAGLVYTFDPVYLPSSFSIAVSIEQRKRHNKLQEQE